jgi:hypothetical protein
MVSGCPVSGDEGFELPEIAFPYFLVRKSLPQIVVLSVVDHCRRHDGSPDLMLYEVLFESRHFYWFLFLASK